MSVQQIEYCLIFNLDNTFPVLDLENIESKFFVHFSNLSSGYKTLGG